MANLKSTETKNTTSIYQSLTMLDSPSSSTSTLKNDILNEKSTLHKDDDVYPSDIKSFSSPLYKSIPSSSSSTSSVPSLTNHHHHHRHTKSNSNNNYNNDNNDMNVVDELTNLNDTAIDKRGNPAACIFVASLNKNKTDEELNITVYKHFEKWGKLINVKVFKDWKDRPYAFVQFERVCDAKIALEEAHGTIIDNRPIRCEGARVNRTLCLTALQLSINRDNVYKELSVFGPIEDISFINNTTGSYCYVRYHYRDDAIRAYLTLQTSIYKSQWQVEWTANINTFETQIVRYDRTCIYVGNIAKSIEKGDLKTRFEKYGIILNITLIQRDEPYYKATFGFIKYSDEKEARAATEYENGQTWCGNVIYVSLREIRPYNKNKQNKYNHKNNNNHNNNNNKNTTSTTTNNSNNGNNNNTTSSTKIVWTTKDGLHSYQQNRPHPPGLNIPAASFYPYHIPITMYSSTPPLTNIKQVAFSDHHQDGDNKKITNAITNIDDHHHQHNPLYSFSNLPFTFYPTYNHPPDNNNNNNNNNNNTSPNENSTIYTPIYTSTPFFATSPYYKPTAGMNYYLSNGNSNNLYHHGYCDSSMNLMPENASNMVTYSPYYYYCYYPNQLNQDYSTAITPLYNSSYYQMYPHAETSQQYMFTTPIPDTPNSSDNSFIKKPTIHEIDQDKDPNCTADTTDDDAIGK
ncbi:unnamed protein product [Cunninghamella blakesleeana]